MRTYDYIMAMKEENTLLEQEMSDDDSDISSDESTDFDSPEKSSRFGICKERIPEVCKFENLTFCGSKNSSNKK